MEQRQERIDHLRDVDAVAAMSREELEAHAKALRTMHAITRALFAAEDEESLDGVLSTIAESTRFPGVAIFVLDEPNGRMELLSARGFSSATLEAARYLPLEGSLTGLAYKRRALVTTDDAGSDPRTAAVVRQQLADDGFTGAASVPLLLGDRVLGAMNLIYKGEIGLTRRERELITSIGSLIAVGLERQRTREARERAEALMRDAQKMEAMGRLAGGIAHDFNNMLAPILMYASILRHGLPEGDPVRAGLLEIEGAAQRAASLTRQLLAFSRRQAVAPRLLDLNGAVQDIERMLGRVVGEDVVIEARLADDLGTVLADPGQLDQVVVNLVVNARDAMPRGGRVTLATSNVEVGEVDARVREGIAPGSYVRLSVTDTGSGMDADTKARVFEPFFTTKEPGKGTGLGLSTVYGIVKQFGGDVRVESEVGAGTTFEIYLPRVGGGEAPAPPSAAKAPSMRARAAETILLVEDDANVRRATRVALEQAGFAVIEAASGPEALLDWMREPARVSCVVTDVVMPTMSGRELRDRMRLVHPGVKIVFVSGYPGDESAGERALEPGTAFLEKPFTPDVLVRAVRAVLDA